MYKPILNIQSSDAVETEGEREEREARDRQRERERKQERERERGETEERERQRGEKGERNFSLSFLSTHISLSHTKEMCKSRTRRLNHLSTHYRPLSDVNLLLGDQPFALRVAIADCIRQIPFAKLAFKA